MLVPLTQGRFATIDEADVDLISRRTWSSQGHSNPSGLPIYAVAKIGGELVRMHIVLWESWGLAPVAMLDHANGDTLDNTRANLRPASRSQNAANSRLNCANTSGYKGVVPEGRRWLAKIQVSGKPIRLGVFDSPAEAHQSYLKAARQHFGEFARAS
jgi:hypothetical protein